MKLVTNNIFEYRNSIGSHITYNKLKFMKKEWAKIGRDVSTRLAFKYQIWDYLIAK